MYDKQITINPIRFNITSVPRCELIRIEQQECRLIEENPTDHKNINISPLNKPFLNLISLKTFTRPAAFFKTALSFKLLVSIKNISIKVMVMLM